MSASVGNSHRPAGPRPTTLEEDWELFVDFSSISCLWFEIQGMRTYNFFDRVSNTDVCYISTILFRVWWVEWEWCIWIPTFCAATRTLSRKRNHSKMKTGRLESDMRWNASSFRSKLCASSMVQSIWRRYTQHIVGLVQHCNLTVGLCASRFLIYHQTSNISGTTVK